MNNLLQDLKFSFRLLIKSPGFTAVAIVTLALAIGVNSAIFSLVNGLVLRPVVPHKPEEIVGVFSTRKDAAHDYRQFAYDEYAALRATHEVFADVAAMNFGLAGIGRDEGMRRSFMIMVSENFFQMMGVQPAAGRFFTAEEARPNANLPVVVASYSLWQRAGRHSDFVGSTLFVNGRPHTVIGVTPKGFSGVNVLMSPEVWLPLGLFSNIAAAFGDAREINDLTSPKNYTLNVMARLQPGLTIESVKARLPVLAERLTAMQPADYTGGARELQVAKPSRFSISTQPEDDGPVGLMGALLVSMAGVVLLIACLNLANMLLARGTGRAREMAVRLAVGATRGQIVRQLFVEGLVLALAGGAVGVLLSYWTSSLIETSFTTLLSSMNFSLAMQLHPDGTVLAVTFLCCLLATLGFSLGPAIKAARTDVVSDLKAQTGDPGAHGKWNRFFAARHLLVMAQMTLSLVLLFSGGLFFRGAIKASDLAPGFNPAGVILTELDYSLANTKQADAMRRVLAAVERARSLPGVEAAGLSTLIPYGNITNTARLIPADAAPVAKEESGAAAPGTNGIYAAITPGYLASIGVKILRGRDFTEAESREKGTVRVGIIDEGMAQKLFPNTDALGQRVRYTEAPTDGLPNEMEIIGIVSPHRHDIQDKNGPARRLYVPLAQNYSASLFLSTRLTAVDPRVVVNTIGTLRKEFRALDRDMPILQMLPFTYLMEKSITLWIVRLGAVMFGIFGGIALLLAVVGVYGVKAYAVERRTREIGIRMALGANRGDVFKLIMKQGAQQTAFSVILGVALSLLVGQTLSAILFQVSPNDPIALGFSAAILTIATLLACYVPARRATQVSPMTALRSE